MAKKPMADLIPTRPQFTLEELQTISDALRIATEDGSIYGGAAEGSEEKTVNAQLDVIHEKIGMLIAITK